jgi:hypothetical protein
MSPDYEQMQLNFHLTSVYDHSLHEAFSRVLHKLTESLPYLEELLNVFCAVSLFPPMGAYDDRSTSSRIHNLQKLSCLMSIHGFTLLPMLLL